MYCPEKKERELPLYTSPVVMIPKCLHFQVMTNLENRGEAAKIQFNDD